MSFRFGELICYRHSTADHDGPIMFLAPCRHDSGSPGLIDILGLGPVFINHKDPTMWRRCWHFEDAARPGDIQVFVDGKDVTDEVIVERLSPGAYQITHSNGEYINGQIEIVERIVVGVDL